MTLKITPALLVAPTEPTLWTLTPAEPQFSLAASYTAHAHTTQYGGHNEDNASLRTNKAIQLGRGQNMTRRTTLKSWVGWG